MHQDDNRYELAGCSSSMNDEPMFCSPYTTCNSSVLLFPARAPFYALAEWCVPKTHCTRLDAFRVGCRMLWWWLWSPSCSRWLNRESCLMHVAARVIKQWCTGVNWCYGIPRCTHGSFIFNTIKWQCPSRLFYSFTLLLKRLIIIISTLQYRQRKFNAVHLHEPCGVAQRPSQKTRKSPGFKASVEEEKV